MHGKGSKGRFAFVGIMSRICRKVSEEKYTKAKHHLVEEQQIRTRTKKISS